MRACGPALFQSPSIRTSIRTRKLLHSSHGQSLSNVVLHIVFSTKHREPTIPPELQDRLYAYVGGILRKDKCIPIRIGGMPDHIHILTTLHPTICQADLLQVTKANSSKWMNKTIGRRGAFDWQDGYGAFSVSSQNVPRARTYIANQAKHHRTKSFQEEFVELLKRSNTPYDPRYIWD
jgi:putative transposase